MLGNNIQEDIIVPFLRNDLKLIPSTPGEDGTKQWLLFDPLQNKYFTIGSDALDLISKWQGGLRLEEFLKILKKHGFNIEENDLKVFINFLKSNSLVKIYSIEETKKVINSKRQASQNIFKWMIHNYLFIKLPIFKPDRWLNNNYKYIEFMYSKLWTNIILMLGIIGIFLVLQRLDEFISTFMYLFSKEGFVYYVLSLLFVKSLHELGHAFTAKRYGCKVPSMGVAFLVLFPVLYTDTTNAYALKSKYKRLRIVFAGMKIEIYLALIATFLWSFLPDGILKSIAFIIATTSWITSLLVNISPFLRFDGYYALSDFTNTKNLQPRSFGMAKWFLRYYLLGLDEQKPENISTKKKNFFIIYAILTWIYRFFLFLGIAILVYFFAFKVLGIILFIVEILWFILFPIFKELKYWWIKRNQVSLNKRNSFFLINLLLFVFIIFYPWKSKVYMPAVLEKSNFSKVYAPQNAQIEEIFIKNTKIVNKGDTLLILKSPQLEHSLKVATKELQLLKYELKQIVSNPELLEKRFILEKSIYKKLKEIEGLSKVQKSLTLKAKVSGSIYIEDNFKKGQYVNKKDILFSIYDNSKISVIAFCEDSDLKYLNSNSEGKFIANNSELKTINLKIKSISEVSLKNLEYPELSSIYGGAIAVREIGKSLISEKAYFKVELDSSHIEFDFKTRIDGKVIVDSENSSLFRKTIIKLYNILVKESSF